MTDFRISSRLYCLEPSPAARLQITLTASASTPLELAICETEILVQKEMQSFKLTVQAQESLELAIVWPPGTGELVIYSLGVQPRD